MPIGNKFFMRFKPVREKSKASPRYSFNCPDGKNIPTLKTEAIGILCLTKIENKYKFI